MFAKSSIYAATFLSILAVLMPVGAWTIHPAPPKPTPVNLSQCNTGTASCCNTVEKASSPAASELLGLLGVVVQGVDALVGLGCTPLNVVGVSQGANCAAQPVCCENNEFNGLVTKFCLCCRCNS